MFPTMRVEDKNIELAITSDSTLLPEADVDDAGLIVRVTGTDKKFTWRQTPKRMDNNRKFKCNKW